MAEFLKCDVPDCDHLETVDAIVETMVGKACPKCGADLLTQSDWDYYSTVVRPGYGVLIDMGLARHALPTDPAEQVVRVNYHDGSLKIRMPLTPTNCAQHAPKDER